MSVPSLSSGKIARVEEGARMWAEGKIEGAGLGRARQVEPQEPRMGERRGRGHQRCNLRLNLRA